MPAPSGQLTAPPRVLLTVTWAGRVWRVADRSVDVYESSTGTWHHYSGGLPELEPCEEAPLFEVGQPPSLSVDASLLADLALYLAEHHGADQAEGEVALYREGDDYTARLVMVRGTVSIDEIGGTGEPLRVTLAGWDPADSSREWPPPDAKAGPETWTTNDYASLTPDPDGRVRAYAEAAEGVPYPWVLGRPGAIRRNGIAVQVWATPVIPVMLLTSGPPVVEVPPGAGYAYSAPLLGQYGLIAGHLVPPQHVHIYDVTAGSTTPCGVYWALDALGRRVSVIGNGALAILRGQVYYCCWDSTEGAGGLPRYVGGPSLFGAGDLIRWALEVAGVPVDWRRCGPVLPLLNSVKISGYWSGTCPAWSWLCDNVFPLLPVSWVPGPNGLYPVLFRVSATSADAVAHLRDGNGGVCFEGPLEVEGRDEVKSGISLEYAQGLQSSKRWKRSRWGSTWAKVGDSPCLHLRRAGLSVADASDVETSTEYVYEIQSSDLAVAWQAVAKSGVRHVARVVGSPRSRVAHLVPGDVVALTSSRLSLSSRVAHVRRAGWRGAICYADAVILPEP